METLFNAVRCLECGHQMKADISLTQCEKCGSFWLDARYNTDALPSNWPTIVKERDYTLWRYAELLPFPQGYPIITMGEGGTPLIRAWGLERELSHQEIWIKDERQLATGSFKDRQAALAVNALKARGVKELVLASTGNAAAAYAAYCARAGIKLWTFVTGSVPAEKVRELALYGAEVVKVTGTYDETKVVAANFAQRHGLYFDRGAKSIPCKESMKTIAFEIVEQLHWQAPDWYVQAVSGGIGPLGVLKGFQELYAAGIISHIPKIAVIQTEGCSPMVRSWEKGLDEAEPVEQPDSLITILATGKPGMAYKILKRAADENGGAMIAVSDGEAFRAMRRVARLEGYSMEPAASVAFAGLEKLVKRGYVKPNEKIVVNCSGHTFSAEKYTLEDRYLFSLTISPQAERLPVEGLTTALASLDEQITTVVVVDDNPNDSRLIRRLLQRYKDYRVFEANDAHDGLELIKQRQPDLVVMDLMMPDMDGFTLLDELKQDPRTKDTPVVIVSAKTLTKEEKQRLQQLADSVWQKGNFSTKQLVEYVVKKVEKTPSADIAGTTAPQATFGQEQRRRILVIESQAQEAQLMRRILETHSRFEVTLAHTAKEAIELIEQHPPELIILTLELPDMSGEALLGIFRTHLETRNTPVIVLTSQKVDADLRTRLALNVDSIWQKDTMDRSSWLSHIEFLLSE